MKAISLTQPWAQLILDGIKMVETRTWKTVHRGDLLICASKKFADDIPDDVAQLLQSVFRSNKYKPKLQEETPQGVMLCVVNLVDIRPMRGEDAFFACYPCEIGRMAWLITDIRPVVQIPIKGKQSIFEVDNSLIKYL